jgi:hypothetical protein
MNGSINFIIKNLHMKIYIYNLIQYLFYIFNKYKNFYIHNFNHTKNYYKYYKTKKY